MAWSWSIHFVVLPKTRWKPYNSWWWRIPAQLLLSGRLQMSDSSGVGSRLEGMRHMSCLMWNSRLNIKWQTITTKERTSSRESSTSHKSFHGKSSFRMNMTIVEGSHVHLSDRLTYQQQNLFVTHKTNTQGSSHQMKGREGWRGRFLEVVSTFQQPGAVRYSYRTWWQQQGLSLYPPVINSFQTITPQTINVVCHSLWSLYGACIGLR